MSIITKIFTSFFQKAIPQFGPELANQVAKYYKLTDPELYKIFPLYFSPGSETKLKWENAYKSIAILYACVRVRAKNIAACSLKLYNYKSDKEITEGFLYDRFERPNSVQNIRSFIEGIVTYLNINGNVYIRKSKEQFKGMSKTLWLLQPTRVTVKRDNKEQWIGYEYDNGKKKEPIPREEMIHIKLFNPYDILEGLAPIEAARMTINTEWYAMKYNQRFFEGDARPPIVYITPPGTTQTEYDKFKLDLKADREGVDRTHKHQVLRGGVEVHDLGITQKDMEFLEQRKFTREEVCMITGVPKSELSLYEDVNFATAISQKRTFWEDQLIPEMKLIEETINHQDLYNWGVYCRFDLSNISALSKINKDKIELFVNLFNTKQFTRNELNEKLDMGFEEVDWGDELPADPIPQIIMPPEKEEIEQREDQADNEQEKKLLSKNIESAEDDEEKKKIIRGEKWQALRQRIDPIETECAKGIRKYFFRCGKKLLQIADKSMPEDEVTVKRFIEDDELESIFDDEKLGKLVDDYLRRAMVVGGETIQEGFKLSSKEALDALLKRVNRVKVVNVTARDKIRDTIKQVVKDRIENGWGEEQAKNELIKALKSDVKELKGNARTIARTETNGAYSDARFIAAEESDPSGYTWLSSRDSKVRDTHQELDGTSIVKGGAWVTSKGNTIRRPHDPDCNDPGEVINCRCDLLVQYGGED